MQTYMCICLKAESLVLRRGRTNNFNNLDQKYPQFCRADTWKNRTLGGFLLYGAETSYAQFSLIKKKHEVNGNCRTKYAEGD